MENVVTIKLDEPDRDYEELHSVSPYARWFNEKCMAWTKHSEANLCYLRLQQDYANGMLKARGYLFLNEVYEMLGIPKTKAGQVVGWIFDPNDPNRDGYVDFGLYKTHNEDFVNGYENSILLDFNVDGCILDRI